MKKGKAIIMKKKWLAIVLAMLICGLTALLPGCQKESTPSSDTTTAEVSSEDDGIFNTDNIFGDDTSSENVASGETSGISSVGTSSSGQTTTPGKNSSQSSGKTSSVDIHTGTGALGDNLPNIQIDNKTLTILSHAKFETPKLLESKYGVKIDTIQVSGETIITRFVTMVNSNQSPDLLWGDYNPQLIAKQYVTPWDGKIDFSSQYWKDVKASNDNWKVGGKYYYAITAPGRQNVVYFNRNLFKAKNLDDPAKLFKEGKWNWTTFKKLVQELTVDKNNDGTPEQYGLSIVTPSSFLYTTGTDFVKFVGGQPKNMIKSNEVARAMQMYIDLNKENKLYTGSDAHEAFAKGKIAMIASEKWVKSYFTKQMETGEMMFAPIPKDPQASAYYVAEETPGFYLPKGSKNPNAAIAFLTVQRFLNTDSQAKEEGLKETLEAGGWSKEASEMEELINSKTTPVSLVWTYFKLGQYFGDIYNRPLAGESWSKVAEELSPKIDNAIKVYKTDALK